MMLNTCLHLQNRCRASLCEPTAADNCKTTANKHGAVCEKNFRQLLRNNCRQASCETIADINYETSADTHHAELPRTAHKRFAQLPTRIMHDSPQRPLACPHRISHSPLLPTRPIHNSAQLPRTAHSVLHNCPHALCQQNLPCKALACNTS